MLNRCILGRNIWLSDCHVYFCVCSMPRQNKNLKKKIIKIFFCIFCLAFLCFFAEYAKFIIASPDILSGDLPVLRQTFWIIAAHLTFKSLANIKPIAADPFFLIYSRWTKCPARSEPFTRHLSNFARHVRRVQRILHTLYFVTFWLAIFLCWSKPHQNKNNFFWLFFLLFFLFSFC